MISTEPSSIPERMSGFSLLELLVVIAIISLLATLIVTGTGALSSSRITTAALEFRAAADLARQKAITSGKPVELRLYKPNGSTGDFSAFRIVSIDGTNSIPLKMNRLPDGIVMKNSPVGSTILTVAPLTNDAVNGFIASETRAIRFLPSGSIEDLPAGAPQTLSIAKAAEPALSNGLPANFATLSFDASLGSCGVYRP